MPIYAYRCSTCGHAKDVLQKMSDPVLTDCPACGAASFVKQVTAAGFQLKGSGWYVTDFKGGSAAPPPADGAKAEADKGDAGKAESEMSAAKGDAAKSDSAKPDLTSAPAVKPDTRSAPPATAPATAPTKAPTTAPAPSPKGAAPAAGGS